jgi:hypothetical protein
VFKFEMVQISHRGSEGGGGGSSPPYCLQTPLNLLSFSSFFFAIDIVGLHSEVEEDDFVIFDPSLVQM